MLTVAKVTGGQAAGYADYLEGKTTATEAGDYYLKDGERVEAAGRWIGGAGEFGVDPAARVTGEQLRALMDVHRPDTGVSLRPVGSTGEAVAALDATFSAPKSVSAVWALADPTLRERIEAAHETAIDRTIHYAAAQVAMVRQRVDRQTVVHARAREVIATGWRHTTARSVDGQLPDPQLHTHVLLHAAVRRDGQVAAIDSRQWFTHRRELGAAYRTELARELTRLGYDITRRTGRGRRYFEITGIPQPLIDRWSSRHHQVQEAIRSRLDSRRRELEEIIATGGPDAAPAAERLADLKAGGTVTAGEDRFLTTATRAGKQPATRRDLDDHWTQTGRDLGVTGSDLTHWQTTRSAARGLVDPALIEAALTEHDATLSRSHVRAIALEQSAGAPIRDALLELARMRDEQDLLTLGDGSLTTRTHRSREQQVVEVAQRLAAGDVEPIPPAVVDRHATALDQHLRRHGGQLSTEQRAALASACGEGQMVMIEGQAGTGKSTVLQAVAGAHQDAGQQIIVTSTAALAAQRLADELTTSDTHPDAYSTVALRHAISDGRLVLDPATTIVHDEAALASTRELDQLLDSVEQSGARLILVGDPRQSHPVGAGGLWPYLETATHDHDAHTTLTRNLRARDPDDARDQARFRDGDANTALEGYADRDRVHLTARQQDAEDAALDAAFTDHQDGKHSLVVVQTSNDHLDELNARAQAIRRQHGQLGDDSLPLAGRPYELHAGDEIQLRASVRHPDHGTLRNGTTATIHHINPRDETAELQLADGRDVDLTRQQLDTAQARLAYVQHPFPAQGTTTDTTHLIIAEHPTQEGTYVALTRAHEQTHLHAATDTLDADQPALPQLADRISRTDPHLPSLAHPLAPQSSDQTPRTQRDPPDVNPIDAYRQKYGVADDDPRPLGPEPAPDAFRQRLDRQQTVNEALAFEPTGDTAMNPLRERWQGELRADAQGREFEGLEPPGHG